MRNLFYAKIFIKIIELLHITKLYDSKFKKKTFIFQIHEPILFQQHKIEIENMQRNKLTVEIF